MTKCVKTYPGKYREIWEEFRENSRENIAISREFPGREIPAVAGKFPLSILLKDHCDGPDGPLNSLWNYKTLKLICNAVHFKSSTVKPLFEYWSAANMFQNRDLNVLGNYFLLFLCHNFSGFSKEFWQKKIKIVNFVT